MTESRQASQSRQPSDLAIEVRDNTFLVDAELVGELLHIPPARVPALMREGRITAPASAERMNRQANSA